MENVNQNINTGQPNGTPPDNYLVWAILSTVLCCIPLGIYSVIKSTEVNKKWQVGDYAGAVKSAETAKKFAIYATIAGVIWWILNIIIFGFYSFSAATEAGAY